MFCSRCGTEVQKSTQFCPTCGLDLRVTSPVQAIATGDVSELDVVRDALQEEYELLEELGRGGMAIVYRARDKHLEREVAIKVLPFSLAFDQEFVERFTREARTAAQLEHPNIISIYRVGKTGRVIYFTMKLVRGGSLSGLMTERKKLTPPEIRKLLAEVGSALGYAHTRGIVHRDIKPDNIMFDEFGQCVVTDFGIAKAGSGSKLTGTGMSIGTPHYMSPEQARAQSIDGRSDLYSLGVLAYQALVGEVPYDGEDSFAIGYKHIMEPIPVPLLDTPDERRLFEVIKRLIQKDPLDRFQTAEDLLRALEGQPLAQAQRRASQAQNTMSVQPAAPSPSSPLQRPSVANIPTPPPPPPRPSIAVPPVAPSVDTPRRPVMRRSVAAVHETQPTNWVPWVLAGLAVLIFLVGAIMLYRRGALGGGGGSAAPDTAQVPPPTSAAPSLPADDRSLDTAIANLDTIGLRPTSSVSDPVPPRTPEAAMTPDTGFGFLRLRNLPPRSVILIDSRPVTQPGGSDIRLSAGWHELGITSPGFALFTDSVKIESGKTLSFGPNLSSARPGVAEPGSRQEMRNRLLARLDCDNPAPLNRFGRECYDTAPQPLASTLVPVPAGVEGTPSGVTVIVKVSYQGRTLVVRTRNPSNDERFTRAVEAYAGTMRWTPAMRDGQPVDGWTQYAFQPATP